MATTNIDELLQKTTLNRFVPKLVDQDGFLMGCNYESIKERMDNLEVKDNDVWVSSFPKTGTTWTQEMVWLIANDLDYEGAEVVQNIRFPFLEMQMMFNWEESFVQSGKCPEHTSNSVEFVNKLKTNPRCIKTHLPWSLLPKSIQNKEKRPKIVYVCRNPKDTCVSYYHHHKLLHHFKGTFEEFATLFLHDKVVYAPYWRTINEYWERRNEPNVLFIKYEDMKRDLKSVVLKVAEFLNKPVADAKLDQLINHLSFNSMKENNSVNYKSLRQELAAPEGDFIRKGIVGDYKNQMTPELIEKFDKWTDENNKYCITF